jgi:hypothetical protein
MLIRLGHKDVLKYRVNFMRECSEEIAFSLNHEEIQEEENNQIDDLDNISYLKGL